MPTLKIYLASPFFNEFELTCVRRAEEILFSRGFDVFSPRLHEIRGAEENPEQWSRETFLSDRDNLEKAGVVVMLYHGNYSDSGTAWEAGYACARGIPVVAVHVGESEQAGSNLMIHESARANISLEALESYDFTALPQKPYRGKTF